MPTSALRIVLERPRQRVEGAHSAKCSPIAARSEAGEVPPFAVRPAARARRRGRNGLTVVPRRTRALCRNASMRATLAASSSRMPRATRPAPAVPVAATWLSAPWSWKPHRRLLMAVEPASTAIQIHATQPQSGSIGATRPAAAAGEASRANRTAARRSRIGRALAGRLAPIGLESGERRGDQATSHRGPAR